MSTLAYIIIFTFLGSIFSLIGGVILLLKERVAHKISHLLAAFAAGALLGTAFLDLLPEALHEGKDLLSTTEVEGSVFLFTLLGVIVFFLLERFIHWFHHHQRPHREPAKPTVPLVVLGDSIHNFIDGMAIAATFLVSVPLGIVTTIAVAAHEIPQEIGDFGILLHEGVKRKKVLAYNLLSALTSLLGAFLTYLLGDILSGFLPYLLAITAGFFIYIAAADIIPDIHQENRKGFALFETGLLIIGILIVWVSIVFLEH